MNTSDGEPPFEGGSQPVHHRKDPVPGAGRSVGQIVVVGLCILAVLAAVVWFIRP